MKIYFSLLIVFFWMISSAITYAQDPNFHIYLAFGQSNMEGAGAIESQDIVGIDARFKVIGAVDCSGDRTLDVSHLPPGFYLIRANAGKKIRVSKVIKQ